MTKALPISADIPAVQGYYGSPRIRWKKRTATRRIILHDSHTTEDVETVQDYLRQKAHQMGLLDIGYHAIIERDGVVIETRQHELIGSHTPGHNLDSIGVCLIGGMGLHGPEDNFTRSQRVGLFGLLRYLQQFYSADGAQPLPIVGHTELQAFVGRKEPCPCLDIEMLREDYAYYLTYGVIP